jgi:hypothetical protein
MTSRAESLAALLVAWVPRTGARDITAVASPRRQRSMMSPLFNSIRSNLTKANHCG